MNTKSFNYFRNAFALIGFFIIACSVASDDENIVDNNDNDITIPIQSNIGKYQIQLQAHLDRNQNMFYTLVALNTETGALKTYHRHQSTTQWTENQNYGITFNH